MHRVFIYGTLKHGFPNYPAGMENFRCVGRFRTVEARPLVVGGKWFSPYLIDEPGERYRVFGEVFEVDAQGLERLDRMEGTHGPNGYRRISVAVGDEDGGKTFAAWVYVKDREAIEVIHAGPMEDYVRDPRYVIPAKRTTAF